tara:strand:- start:525 stop:689 length:165 start_codon:yes stop_codon:yes gene_type:complete
MNLEKILLNSIIDGGHIDDLTLLIKCQELGFTEKQILKVTNMDKDDIKMLSEVE